MNQAIIYFAVAAIVTLVWLVAKHDIKRTKTRKAVFRNLDAAFANGYFLPGEQLDRASPDEIAYDMTCYAVDFENVRPETLTPYVREWMRQKGF